MDNILTTYPVVVAFLGGVLVHQCVFRRFELDNYPFTIAGAFLYLLHYLSKQFGPPQHAPASADFVRPTSFFLGFWASVIVYRAFFHPLKSFPGPFAARISKFWSVYRVARSQNRWYKVDQDLHAQYGDYVRVGPRELSITDPDAINVILGSGSKTDRGPFYGSLEKSLHTTRDKEFHRQRRRIWDNAFKIALADFAPSVEAATDNLLARIARINGRKNDDGSPADNAVHMNDITQRYSFDVMSAMAFGEPTGFLDGTADATDEHIFSSIHEFLIAMGLLIHTPWMLVLLETIARVLQAGPMQMYSAWSAGKVDKRKKMTNPPPDLMGHLLAHTPDDADGRKLLNAESRTIIGAGSDTTASALVMLFTHLSVHRRYVKQLRAELDPLVASDAFSCLRPASPTLDAVINEILRLYPPVIWGSQRVAPADGGLRIGEVYIPPDTIVSLSPWSVSRDPRNFSRPNDFVPERWTEQPELVKNRAAFLPFLTGGYSCPGKGLAMMELRSVVARVVTQYDVVWVDEERKLGEWVEGVKDYFTVGVPDVQLIFRERVREEEGL